MVQSMKPLESRSVRAEESTGYFYLPAGSANVSNVTEKDYLELITDFQARYGARVLEKTGKPLLIPNEWDSPYFAAFAIPRDTHFQVSLWGGTVRAPGFVKPLIAAILCHEIGHILGGEPLQTIPGSEWASTEGQSDFFAAKTCLPEFFSRHPELIGEVDPKIQKMCDGNEACQKTAQAGWLLVNLFQKYSYHEYVPVSLDVKAEPAKELIRNSYPSDQCRLDTFIQGALCQSGSQCGAPVCWSATN